MSNSGFYEIISIINVKLSEYSTKVEYLKLCKENIINSGDNIKKQANAIIIIDMELRAYQFCINEINEIKNRICTER